MDIADFDYELPPELIAQEPLPERDASRLMVLDRATGALRGHEFRALPDLLDPGDLLVVNRSRVFPARLLGRRRNGGVAEVLLLRPLAADHTAWEALLRPGRRLRVADTVVVAEDDLTVTVESDALSADGRRRVRLTARHEAAGLAIRRLGHTPLPPYVKRPDRPEDRERYQTIYAREEGSVAAPTAGLHFTEALLRRLDSRGIERAEVLLHVGPGTFRPVEAKQIENHRVEPEAFVVPEVTAAAVRRVRERHGRVVAVGTTTVRALESAADDDGTVAAAEGTTDCVIVPGFSFRVVDALVTNFHLPRSSLLLLVAAFAGRERILGAYAEAARRRYRFYSYGDAMLML
jgi:S-adenosylmethionine:tRNA ribosyltransferase-isomerase